MADLTPATALTTIEQALQTRIIESLGKRLTVATLTALRALASNARSQNELAYVTAAAYAYRWSRYSTAADNGTTVIKPTDNPTAGRWLRTSSTSSSGYLQAVELYEGQAEAEEILDRFGARKPCVVIVFMGADNEVASQVPGALYKYRADFALWCLSSNLRPGHEAAVGSPISAEATADPGVNRIVGDLRTYLAGHDLDQDGVQWCELGREERVYTSLADRLMVYQLRVQVRAVLHYQDTDLVTLADPRFADVQRQIVDLRGSPDDFDPDNYIASGFEVTTNGGGLGVFIGTGTAAIGGTEVTTSSAATATLEAMRDSWVYMNASQTFSVLNVAIGSDAPTTPDDYLPLVVITTNNATFTSWRYASPTLADFEDPDQVPAT